MYSGSGGGCLTPSQGENRRRTNSLLSASGTKIHSSGYFYLSRLQKIKRSRNKYSYLWLCPLSTLPFYCVPALLPNEVQKFMAPAILNCQYRKKSGRPSITFQKTAKKVFSDNMSGRQVLRHTTALPCVRLIIVGWDSIINSLMRPVLIKE